MIICRKCQRHHPDDVGDGPCECGADLSRDGIAIGPSPAGGSTVFADDSAAASDPFAVATDPTATDPFAVATDPPADASPSPVNRPSAPATPPAASTREAEVVRPDPPPSPAHASTEAAPAAPKRRAPSVTPSAFVGEPEEPEQPTDQIAVVEAAEVDVPARRARGVTPSEVLAAQEKPDAANVGEALPDDDTAAPTSSVAAAPTQPIEVATREPGPGELACPACREPNADTRRFCFNCGSSLPTPVRDEDDELPEMKGPQRRSLWSRLTGSKEVQRTARTFRGRAKMAGGGKFRYATGFSSRAKLSVLVAVLVGGGGVMMLLGPYKGLISGIVDRGPQGTSPDSAEVIDATEISGFPAESAVDGDTDTGFAFFFDPDGEFAELTVGGDPAVPAPPSSAPALEDGGGETEEPTEGATVDSAAPTEPGTLVVRLEEPAKVTKLYIAVGLPDSVEDGPLMQRPSRVQVCAEAENCQELELDNSTSLKKYSVSFGDEVRIIRITPLDVHEALATSYPLAVISEVRVGK